LACACACACGGDDGVVTPDAGEPIPSDIAEFLAEIEGLAAVEDVSEHAGYRRFVLSFEQPIDHDDPAAGSFDQRAILHHRERARPMVLYTSGYYLFSEDRLAELSGSMAANQIDIEQRFFAPSTPEPTRVADWELVRIRQAAADHHRWVEALAPFYDGAWLSTGHSKGGMTSIYHRRFYPYDVDATVAYVAPISFFAGDTRYHSFFDNVADAECRQALRDLQRELLTRRAEMIAMAEQLDPGATYARLGGVDLAFEASVVGLPWSFFQVGSTSFCPSIPGPGATDLELFDFFANVAGMFTDASIEPFATYYYQAEAELGYPNEPTAHLDDLLTPDSPPADLLPAGVTATHDPAPMADIDTWVRTEGRNLLFVYGENDPWFGGAFELGDAIDSFKLVVPGANHGALISELPAGDRTEALDAIERWTGTRPQLEGLFARFRHTAPPETRIRLW
jgi:hypothetical protein